MNQTSVRDSFSPELRLLLECSHQQPDAQQTERIRRAASLAIDWVQFQELAERHRVVPSVYLALRQAADDLVPPREMKAFASRFHRNTRRNLMVGGELSRIATSADQAGIPVMCLKGPGLALQIYGGLERRQFKDLDLLVRPEHLVRTVGILNQLGYHETHARISSLGPKGLQRLIRLNKDITLVNPDRPGAMVELHWRLCDFGTPRITFDSDRMWSQQLVVGNSRVYVLPLQDQIVFLAWHGGQHRWKRASWLFDLAQAVRTFDHADEATVSQVASDAGASTYLKLGLLLIRELTGVQPAFDTTEVPTAGLDSRYCSDVPADFRRQFETSCHAMMADEMYYEGNAFRNVTWVWQMTPSWQMRLESLLRVLKPNSEFMHLSGPRAYLKRLQRIERRLRHTLIARIPGLQR